METKPGRGIGLCNRFDALYLDDVKDPLDDVKPKKKSRNKKKRPCKKTSAKAEVKSEPCSAQAKSSNYISSLNVKDKVILLESPPKNKATADLKYYSPKSIYVLQGASLDEYKERVYWQRRFSAQPLKPKKLRKPGEGEEQGKWDKLVPLDKKMKEAEGRAGTSGNGSQVVVGQRAARQKQLSVALEFNENVVRRGQTRLPLPLPPAPVKVWNRKPPPAVDSETEFPALGQ